jgi:hypothetical protein
MATKINIQYIDREIMKAAYRYKNLAKGASQSRVNSLKNKLIEEFLNHTITKEIEGGADAENLSGAVSRGNLFSFIGFPEGADPITPVVNLLEKNISLGALEGIKKDNYMIIFSFPVLTPTKKELQGATPLPWMVGRSWLTGVEEEGISGVGNYLFHRFFPREKSRSTSGLQSKRGGMGAVFTPKPYLLAMLKKFEREI